jgi:hypothetical protein
MAKAPDHNHWRWLNRLGLRTYVWLAARMRWSNKTWAGAMRAPLIWATALFQAGDMGLMYYYLLISSMDLVCGCYSMD